MSAGWQAILKRYVNSGKNGYVVYIKANMLKAENSSLLYILKLVCYWK